MNSLPNYPTSTHTKKHFSPISKPCLSIQTVPDDSDFNVFPFQKRNSLEFLKNRLKKSSNMLKRVIEDRKNNIFLSVLKNIFLPNLIAFLFISLMMKIEDDLQLICHERDKNIFSYLILRDNLFRLYFYNWGVGLCLFFEEKHHKIVNTFIFLSVLGIIFSIDYSEKYVLRIGKMNFDHFIFPSIFQVFVYLFLKIWQRRLRKMEFFRICFAVIMFIFVFIEHFIIRLFLIEQIYLSLQDFPNHKIYFQCFLFFFYQIHGLVFLSILTRFRSKIPSNLFLYAIKYYIINVLSSCTMFSIVYNEEKYIHIFAILNFTTQLLSLYMQNNIFWHYCCQLIKFFKKKKDKVSENKKDDNFEIKAIIAGLTNESMYGITFTLLNIIIFNKTFQFSLYDYGPKKDKNFCLMDFDGLVSFNPQNLCLLFTINFFYFFYLLYKLKDDKKIKFIWKMEDYSFPIRIFSIILFQGNADIHFQFYMYLNLLDKN